MLLLLTEDAEWDNVMDILQKTILLYTRFNKSEDTSGKKNKINLISNLT